MRLWMCLSVLVTTACARSVDESPSKGGDADSTVEDGTGTTEASPDADDTAADDTAEPAPEAFIPDEGRYESADFRLKEDSCGIDSVAPVTSLMPGSYGLTADTAADRFLLASSEQGTETGCTVGPLDPETGLALFTCDSFREGYRSPYGNGFDMEVSFEGEITEDQVVAGGLTVILHCMVGDYCAEFARNGVAFPCTIGGDLVLQPASRD